ncbi:Protein of unknown function [Bacillus wiedmannii]|nr:Protein of unknown function [Bacillus wiedmannii]
MDELNNE